MVLPLCKHPACYNHKLLQEHILMLSRLHYPTFRLES
uniref:Uncharacterized protein n=1 Tax=Arundo donax TaxID=35708 RepID=A0A0A9AGV1_ARUDO